MDAPGWIETIVAELDRSGLDLRAVGLGWARAAPVVAIVPAFGLRALPGPVRALMGLCLAACVAPALRETVPTQSWAWALVMSAVSGIPIALAAAIPLWAATMAGGAIDAVRGAGDQVQMPTIEGRPTWFGVPMALLASAIFLTTGGPARVASALATPAPMTDAVLLRAAFDTVAGIHVAVAVAAPVLAAAVVIEVSSALIARAASPTQIQSLIAPLRAFAILAVAAFTLDRMVRVLAVWIGRPLS